jgi:ubiquinone/menaquinone biosynthesis C-methylase UbiE
MLIQAFQYINLHKRWAKMADRQAEYLLSQAPNEIVRLQSWARSWEPETEAMLDRIQIQAGWRCLDLACGPLGIIDPLSRRVGPTGQVIGADINTAMLTAARSFAEDNGLKNVDFVETNTYQSGLPRESFDLVHARFMFAPLGRDDILLNEMIALTRPGGIIASQESDESGYVCYPRQPAWERLKQLTIAAFRYGGGNYSAGRRTYGLLHRAGMKNVQARAAILALPAGHPYRIWPIESAIALRGRMLEWELINEIELDRLLGECERIASDPNIFLTSFVVMQVWGCKPEIG